MKTIPANICARQRLLVLFGRHGDGKVAWYQQNTSEMHLSYQIATTDASFLAHLLLLLPTPSTRSVTSNMSWIGDTVATQPTVPSLTSLATSYGKRDDLAAPTSSQAVSALNATGSLLDTLSNAVDKTSKDDDERQTLANQVQTVLESRVTWMACSTVLLLVLYVICQDVRRRRRRRRQQAPPPTNRPMDRVSILQLVREGRSRKFRSRFSGWNRWWKRSLPDADSAPENIELQDLPPAETRLSDDADTLPGPSTDFESNAPTLTETGTEVTISVDDEESQHALANTPILLGLPRLSNTPSAISALDLTHSSADAFFQRPRRTWDQLDTARSTQASGSAIRREAARKHVAGQHHDTAIHAQESVPTIAIALVEGPGQEQT
ncbi:hypothetical protein S40288_11324 [Stachybotrys chartarum IBT 40288]|nr:hypothetical protein S40288_11324 [Stachybotrys chartarum IBT 40288]